MRLVMAHTGGRFRDEIYQLITDHLNAYTDISALQEWIPFNPDMPLSKLK